jgi:tetratricopeptide (TPR) repeat protein
MLAVVICWSHQVVAEQNLPPGEQRTRRRVFPPGRPVETKQPLVALGYYHRQPHVYPRHHGYRSAPPYPVPHRWPHRYPYRPYYYHRYYYAPLYIPAGELYGPQATARFLGWNTFGRRVPDVAPVAPPENADRRMGALQRGEAAEGRNLRGTNPEAVALGWKFIGFGDAHFANQKYSDALQRYRKAVQAAPQLAAGYFRQGYALAAMGRYELAAKALKHGLTLEPAWPASGFHNDELYGRGQAAKTAQFEAMLEAAEQQPHDADLMFLLGVYYHFDGEPDRAAVFFGRAAQLVGGGDAHLRAFVGAE